MHFGHGVMHGPGSETSTDLAFAQFDCLGSVLNANQDQESINLLKDSAARKQVSASEENK